MNRRELLTKAAAVCAATGVANEISLLDGSPPATIASPPLMIVVRVGSGFDIRDKGSRMALRREIAEMIGPNCPPVAIIPSDWSISTVPAAMSDETDLECHNKMIDTINRLNEKLREIHDAINCLNEKLEVK